MSCMNIWSNNSVVFANIQTSVSVSDEIVKTNQEYNAFIFSICIYFLPQKYSLFTSDKHYLWNGIDFESVFLFKFIHFYKKFVA